jgi:hypothetical protein
MKIITENETNEVTYAIEDDVDVNITADCMTVGPSSSPRFRVKFYNSSNVTLHTGVTLPDDWYGRKYKYDGSNWSANENYIGFATVESFVASDATSIPLIETDGKPLRLSLGVAYIQATNEKITYTGIDGNTLTGVTRGVDSTTATDIHPLYVIHEELPS